MAALLTTHPPPPALPFAHPAMVAAIAALAACTGELGGGVAPRMAEPLTAHAAAVRKPAPTVRESGPVGPARVVSGTPASALPVAALDTYLDGFHLYNGRPAAQVAAHHYCANVNADVAQCAVYDGPGRDAHLVGVEYIVSERIFRGLPADEKALWHSHAYDVRAGMLVAPELGADDHALMAGLAPTYGKTWRTWRTDARDAVPLGIPQLMMGFTDDGQADLRLLAERDRRLGVSSAAHARLRADLPVAPVDAAANGGERGWSLQLELQPQRTAEAVGAEPP